MSSNFAGRFTRDNEWPDHYTTKFTATIPRPFMKESKVVYVLRQDGLCYPDDGPIKSEWSPDVSLEIDSESRKIEPAHEAAWKFVIDERNAVGSIVRKAAWERCKRNYKEFLSELEDSLQHPDVEPHECQWESMKKIDWASPASLDLQVCLNRITLFERKELVCVAFDFSVGWDDEHGMSVITHRDNVVAINGAADFGFTDWRLRFPLFRSTTMWQRFWSSCRRLVRRASPVGIAFAAQASIGT